MLGDTVGPIAAETRRLVDAFSYQSLLHFGITERQVRNAERMRRRRRLLVALTYARRSLKCASTP